MHHVSCREPEWEAAVAGTHTLAATLLGPLLHAHRTFSPCSGSSLKTDAAGHQVELPCVPPFSGAELERAIAEAVCLPT